MASEEVTNARSMAMTDPRRRVPRTDAILADPRLTSPSRRLGDDLVKHAVRRVQQQVRDGALEPDRVVEAVLAALPARAAGLRPVVNATGVLVHTNLGRAPLSPAAREAVVAASGTTDVEYDLASGQRSSRGREALGALAEAVPAAGDVHLVNNNAAALLLCALALAPAGRDIVIGRGELVEIGDGFRIPDLVVSAGARLREVGTTNRTTVADYAAAIGPDTGFVLKVHPSNFRVCGFTATPSVAELAGMLARQQHRIPLVTDIGSGLLHAHRRLPDEPDAERALAAGADLVTASGDKLLGGPQAGLILGDAALVQRLRRHPAARAMRVDKLTLAAFEATLRGPCPPVRAGLERTVEQLRPRAERMVARLRAVGVPATVVPCASAVGGGGAPGVTLPSVAVGLPRAYARPLRTGGVDASPDGAGNGHPDAAVPGRDGGRDHDGSCDRDLSRDLSRDRAGNCDRDGSRETSATGNTGPADDGRPVRVVGRVEHDRCLLDLRTVDPADDEHVLAAVRAAVPAVVAAEDRAVMPAGEGNPS